MNGLFDAHNDLPLAVGLTVVGIDSGTFANRRAAEVIACAADVEVRAREEVWDGGADSVGDEEGGCCGDD